MSRFVSLIVLLAIIVVTGLLFYKVMVGFFVPVFLAAVLVVVFRPLHRWILKATGMRQRLAALATTILIMLSVLLPAGLIVTSAAVQGAGLISSGTPAKIKFVIDKLRDSLGLQLNQDSKLLECQKQVEAISKRAEEVRANDGSTADPELTNLGEKFAESLRKLEEEVSQTKGPAYKEAFDKLRDRALAVGQPQEEDLGYVLSASDLAENFRKLKVGILGGSLMAWLKERANPTKEQIAELKTQIFEFMSPRLLSFTGATSSFLVQLAIGSIILIISIYFFLHDGPAMVTAIMALSPLDDRYEAELLMEFDNISRAMVLATLLAAITQGLVAGLGYFVAGVPSLLPLIILTMVFAMIPFVGPAIVWVPVCMYLAFYQDRIWAAVGLATWGLLVVATVDNVVKAYVLHGQSQLHPLLALLSVLGGVQALGPIGIVVGPMVVAMLQTLLSILQREMVHFEDQALLVPGASPAPRQSRSRLRKRKKPEPHVAPSSDAAESGEPDSWRQPAAEETPIPPAGSPSSPSTEHGPSPAA